MVRQRMGAEQKAGMRRLRPIGGRRGFALLIVVVLLAMISLMLARVAIIGLGEARQAVDSAKRLRQRWAVTSLRQFCESHQEALLLAATEELSANADSQDASVERVRSAEWRLTIAGNLYDIAVADESAKLNLSACAQLHPLETVLDQADRLVPAASGWQLRTLNELASTGGNRSQRLESWLAGTVDNSLAEDLKLAAGSITLWGDGRLNLLRADPQVIDAAWRIHFGSFAPDEIHALRTEKTSPSSDALIGTLGLREEQAKLFKRFFQLGSNCYSVWVIADDGTYDSSYLFVNWGGTGSAREHLGFVY